MDTANVVGDLMMHTSQHLLACGMIALHSALYPQLQRCLDRNKAVDGVKEASFDEYGALKEHKGGGLTASPLAEIGLYGRMHHAVDGGGMGWGGKEIGRHG